MCLEQEFQRFFNENNFKFIEVQRVKRLKIFGKSNFTVDLNFLLKDRRIESSVYLIEGAFSISMSKQDLLIALPVNIPVDSKGVLFIIQRLDVLQNLKSLDLLQSVAV